MDAIILISQKEVSPLSPLLSNSTKLHPSKILKVREAVDNLLQEACVIQDTQFQIKEGVDWHRLHRRKFRSQTSDNMER